MGRGVRYRSRIENQEHASIRARPGPRRGDSRHDGVPFRAGRVHPASEVDAASLIRCSGSGDPRRQCSSRCLASRLASCSCRGSFAVKRPALRAGFSVGHFFFCSARSSSPCRNGFVRPCVTIPRPGNRPSLSIPFCSFMHWLSRSYRSGSAGSFARRHGRLSTVAERRTFTLRIRPHVVALG